MVTPAIQAIVFNGRPESSKLQILEKNPSL